MNRSLVGALLGTLCCFAVPATWAAEPLSIADAVGTALIYSPYLQAQSLGQDVAAEKVSEARAMKRPKVSMGVTQSRTNSPMMAFGSRLNQGRITMQDFAPNRLNDPDHISNLQVGAQVMVPLSLGGMDRHAVRAASKGVAVADLDLRSSRQEVIFRTIETYLGVILARESVLVAEKALAASGESVKDAEAAVAAMRAVKSDLLQASVHHAQNEETLLRMRNQYDLAREGLATMMGVPSAKDYDLTMPFLEQACQTCRQDPQELLTAALKQRPDFLKVAAQRQALRHQSLMYRGKSRPHVFVGAAVEHNSENIGGDGHSNNMLFARIDWNIADGGEMRHKSRGARKQAHQLGKMAEALKDRIHLEIREAITNINNALERIRVSKQAMAQSEESLRILRNRYAAGMAIMSDVLGMETSLLSHRMNHVKALYDYTLSRARLKMALGELTPETCEALAAAK